MAKFSDIAKGRLLLSEPVDVPLPHVVDEDGKPIVLHLRFRVLTPLEASNVLAAARGYAKSQGVESPEVGEPIYEEARRVETLAAGCVDVDAKDGSEPPYFDGGAQQIRDSKKLTSDVVHFLYELHEVWSEEHSLQKSALYDKNAFEHVVQEAALGNLRPFFELRPAARSSCFASTASQLETLRRDKLLSSPDSTATTTAPRPEGEAAAADVQTNHHGGSIDPV